MKRKLGKIGPWYFVRIILLSPVWLIGYATSKPEERKSWKLFTSAMIHHDHQYTGELILAKNGVTFHRECDHLGCNYVLPEHALQIRL